MHDENPSHVHHIPSNCAPPVQAQRISLDQLVDTLSSQVCILNILPFWVRYLIMDVVSLEQIFFLLFTAKADT